MNENTYNQDIQFESYPLVEFPDAILNELRKVIDTTGGRYYHDTPVTPENFDDIRFDQYPLGIN